MRVCDAFHRGLRCNVVTAGRWCCCYGRRQRHCLRLAGVGRPWIGAWGVGRIAWVLHHVGGGVILLFCTHVLSLGRTKFHEKGGWGKKTGQLAELLNMILERRCRIKRGRSPGHNPSHMSGPLLKCCCLHLARPRNTWQTMRNGRSFHCCRSRYMWAHGSGQVGASWRGSMLRSIRRCCSWRG